MEIYVSLIFKTLVPTRILTVLSALFGEVTTSETRYAQATMGCGDFGET
jgi:hypothetical protein